MSPPTVRVNTFVKEDEAPYVDPISKVFIMSEAIFGLDRLPLIGRGKLRYVFLSFMIFLIVNGLVIFMMIQGSDYLPVDFTMVVLVIENITCTLFSFTQCKWMVSYYGELNNFDTEAGCRPKVSMSCVRNLLLAILSCIFTVALYVIPVEIGVSVDSPKHFILIHFVYILEVYYFGHLLNLLTPRLRLINYYIESSLSSATFESSPILKDFVYFKSYDPKIAQCRMRKLMDLYQIIVDAYENLIEGIKWQLLGIIISAFLSVLGFLYFFSLAAIRSGGVLKDTAILQVGVTLTLMTPLFAPCVFGDSVHSEVKKLRELLASRLYENKLDKSGRSVARALLAFTETRDLSFRLLRMLNIDISLPFKFVGLLVTYLIILLQFEKVINPYFFF